MFIFAMIAALGVLITALVVVVGLSAPGMLAGSAISAATLRLALARFASHWPNARSVGIAASTLPALIWLLAFSADLWAYIQNLLDPPGRYMIAFTIMLTPACLIAFGVGLVAAMLAVRRKPPPQ